MTLTREQILAIPAGPELDRLISEKVMGIGPTEVRICGHAGEGSTVRVWSDNPAILSDGSWDAHYLRCHGEPPPYSTDIGVAWQVVNRLFRRWFFDLGGIPRSGDPIWEAKFWDAEPCISGSIGHISGLEEYKATAGSVPLAICRAALLATLYPNP